MTWPNAQTRFILFWIVVGSYAGLFKESTPGVLVAWMWLWLLCGEKGGETK